MAAFEYWRRNSVWTSFGKIAIVCGADQIPDFNLPINQQYDESSLFAKIAEGDEQAYKDLFLIYIPFLLPTVRKLVKSSQAADDIVQEVFMKIWIYRDKLPDIENPRSWVLRVTYNSMATFLSKEKKQVERVVALSGRYQQVDQHTEEQLDYKILRDLVAAAVNELPERQKQIYRLVRNEGKSLQDVAEELGISLQTVKNTMRNALQTIREVIIQSGYPLITLVIFFSDFF
ncbi:MAG: sigma-70 family RNA polymerase sigma factor [Chitinophagaceae bacterium]|nr:sigma-70 family RNA polymerase sigma factor [Chitinophagaceae bacterium]